MDLRLIQQVRVAKLIEDFNGPTITADAVLNGIDQGDSRHWTRDDFPCLTPPFADFFVEGRSQVLPYPYQMGMRVTDTRRWVSNEESFQGLPPKSGTAHRLVFQAYNSMKSSVFVHPGLVICHIDATGHLLDDIEAQTVAVDQTISANINDFEWCMDRGYLTTTDAMNALPMTYMTISLLHCKNISTQENTMPRQQRRQYERRYGTSPDLTYTLSVRSRGSTNRIDGHEPMGLLREHIRRGHFKTYTQESPLFGKHVGTYFWPQEMRGNPKRGTITKDYDISRTMVKEGNATENEPHA